MRARELVEYTRTNSEVLKYVKSQHHDWSSDLDYSVMNHEYWKLDRVPMSMVKVPDEDNYELDDYKRIMDFDDETIADISKDEINARPIVIDHNGVILDGNHRAIKAQKLGMTHIPAYYPVKE